MNTYQTFTNDDGNSWTSRRVLLGGTAALAVGSIAACTPGTTPQQVVASVIDAVMKEVAQACGFIPIATSVVSVIVTMFPAAAGVATVSAAILQEIANAICKANVAPAAGAPLVVKSGDNSVEVHGFHIVNGKPVYV